MTLTQKETDILKDLKAQEELCIEKYAKYADAACDPSLKNLFSEIKTAETTHLDTINRIMNGEEVAMPTAPKSANEAKYREPPHPARWRTRRTTPTSAVMLSPWRSMCRRSTTPACLNSARPPFVTRSRIFRRKSRTTAKSFIPISPPAACIADFYSSPFGRGAPKVTEGASGRYPMRTF